MLINNDGNMKRAEQRTVTNPVENVRLEITGWSNVFVILGFGAPLSRVFTSS